MKHLACLDRVSPEDIHAILSLADRIAVDPKTVSGALNGRAVAMFFQKPSTRMRFAFEVGAARMGATTSIFKTSDLHLSRGESVADTARVMSHYFDAIVIRGRSQQDLEDFVQFGSMPVINGLTAKYYPVGAVDAAFTLMRHFGRLEELKLAYVGDGNNIAHSLMLLGPKVGMDISVITPEWYEPSLDVTEQASALAAAAGTGLEVTNDLAAVEGADIVFTDVWISMGLEEEREERMAAFQPYQVNRELLDRTGKDPVVLHCMPVRRGEEISAEIAARSLIDNNAANLLHVAQAILFHLLKEEK